MGFEHYLAWITFTHSVSEKLNLPKYFALSGGYNAVKAELERQKDQTYSVQKEDFTRGAAYGLTVILDKSSKSKLPAQESLVESIVKSVAQKRNLDYHTNRGSTCEACGSDEVINVKLKRKKDQFDLHSTF